MAISQSMTAEQFVAERDELPDGGRWVELAAGQLVTLSPPTIEHGTAVLNFTKQLATHTQSARDGYACFELGLLLRRQPDTLLFPAVSYFSGGPLFAESDKVYTESRPTLIVEVASTNDRRRGLDQRVSSWLQWGVPQVWVFDPQQKQVHVVAEGSGGYRLSIEQELWGQSALPGFRMSVADLFREPAWAK
ncbi:MAG: Uma2 family endonuclease [Planctomycetes bacterium]|nr:Uma2 family endonuclease [Planctomycetota bacterium]